MPQSSPVMPDVLFAVELHSCQPEELVRFYERELAVKFQLSTYPFRRYIAELGRAALIISQSEGHSDETASESGKVTLSFLTRREEPGINPRYFLHCNRPIGGVFPVRHATREKDPDGNYLALALALPLDTAARVPRIFTLSQLLGSVAEYIGFRLKGLGSLCKARLDELLDVCEYFTDRSIIVNRELGEYTHIVASLAGLFVVNGSSYRQILRGKFFGVTVKDGTIYCFQGCSYMRSRGRLLKITTRGGRIDQVTVIGKGLDDGCHQIDFVGEDLLVVDCYNGRILQMREGASEIKMHYPLGKLSRQEATSDCHINSLAGHPDGTIWLLLHNSGRRHSEVVVLNSDFEVMRRFPVDAGGAHNIVFTDDESEYLIADSFGGRIISSRQTVVGGDMQMPRGISLDQDGCVIGEVFLAARPQRRYVPGRVHFFDRHTWELRSSVSLPGGPTDIRRIDGKDLSISNYFGEQMRNRLQGQSR